MAQAGCLSDADLRAFQLGQLPEDVSRAVSAHLETCPVCEARAGCLDGVADSVLDGLRRAFDAGQAEATAGGRCHQGPLPTPAPKVASATSLAAAGDGTCGTRYRILRPHARGGLGEVFVAEDRELRREVALKEIQERHAHDPASKGRFLLEAEITGGLEHPGIVPVYGLGAHADGRPYYAMRLVHGHNLKEAIEHFHAPPAGGGRQPPALVSARNLEFRQLLRRFIDVCNAVAYAHSRGVLHRDLKPDNVMLGKYGETLVVDWGLAKAMAQPAAETALPPGAGSGPTGTVMGTALGTPAYMSPEQAAGRLDVVGPASDVYGLGATLYTVLTGRPPFADAEAAEVLRQVERGDVPAPRQVKLGVPRPLEAVCQKAMARRPEDRYASAGTLADEIEHWLADEPVAAYREPLLPRLGRWGRRHRGLTAATASLLLTAVVLLSVSVVLIGQEQRRTEQANADLGRALDAEAQRRREAREALDAMSSQIVDDLLAQQKAKQLTDEQKAFLNKAVASYERFAHDTDQDEASRAGVAAAYLRVGNIRTKLGQTAEAEAAYRRGAQLYTSLATDFGAERRYRQELAATMNKRGIALADLGRRRDAERVLREALAVGEQLASDFPAEPECRQGVALTQDVLGSFLEHRGNLTDAEAAYRAALAVRARLVADFPDRATFRRDLAASHVNVGNLDWKTGRPKQAEDAYRAALAIHKRLANEFPGEPAYTQLLAVSYNNLGQSLMATGRATDAEAALREALGIRKRLAAEFPAVPAYLENLGFSHNGLGALLLGAGRTQDAEAAYRAALAIRKALAADFPAVPEYRQHLAMSHHNLGLLLVQTERLQEAETSFREALSINERLASEFPAVPTHRSRLAEAHNSFGALLVQTGRTSEGEAAFHAALSIFERLAAAYPTVPAYQNDLAGTLANLGRVFLVRGDYAQARRTFERALPYHRAALHSSPREPTYRQFYRNNRRGLTQALLGLGDHGAAAEAASQILETGARPGADAYTTAFALAVCVRLAEQDQRFAAARRQILMRSYADRAMTALRQAVREGFQDLAVLTTDPNLAPLRGRADFKQLVAELEVRAKKPAR